MRRYIFPPAPAVWILISILPAACGFRESPNRRHEAALSYLRAKDLYIAGNWDGALRILRERAAGNAGFSASGFLEGKILFFQKNRAGAEGVWRMVLRWNPHHGETLKWLCRLLILDGRAREAENLVAPALENDPEDAELLILAGKSRLLVGDTAGGLEYFTKAKACFERLAEAPLELADLYRSFGLRRRSIEELELAARMLGRDNSLYRTVSEAAEFLKREEP